MQQLSNYLNKSWTQLLSGLLMMLGFSACNWEDPENDPDTVICMYGTPTATFSIKGKVMNQDQQALSGIRIIVANREKCQQATTNFTPDHPVVSTPVNDTIYTDLEGKFTWHDGTLPSDTIRYELQFHDTDTTPNEPHYRTDTVKVEFLDKNIIAHETGNPWNRGKAEKTIEVILKKEGDEQ